MNLLRNVLFTWLAISVWVVLTGLVFKYQLGIRLGLTMLGFSLAASLFTWIQGRVK